MNSYCARNSCTPSLVEALSTIWFPMQNITRVQQPMFRQQIFVIFSSKKRWLKILQRVRYIYCVTDDVGQNKSTSANWTKFWTLRWKKMVLPQLSKYFHDSSTMCWSIDAYFRLCIWDKRWVEHRNRFAVEFLIHINSCFKDQGVTHAAMLHVVNFPYFCNTNIVVYVSWYQHAVFVLFATKRIFFRISGAFSEGLWDIN